MINTHSICDCVCRLSPLQKNLHLKTRSHYRGLLGGSTPLRRIRYNEAQGIARAFKDIYHWHSRLWGFYPCIAFGPVNAMTLIDAEHCISS